MPVVLRRNTAEKIFGIIAPMEDQCGFSRRLQRYRKSGPWLLSESYLNRVLLMPGRHHDAFPGLKLGSTAAGRGVLLWRRCVGRTVATCSAADAVRVKSNLRSFYQKHQAAAKLILEENSKRIQGIRNEVAIRSQVQGFKCLQIPRVLAHNIEGKSPWYTEELIRGRIAESKDAALINQRLLPGLFAMYRKFGIVWKTSPVAGRGEFHRRVQSAMGRVRWRGEWMPKPRFVTFVRVLVGNESLMPYSMCHGDLSPTNIIVTPREEPYLIDWETVEARPVMQDLCGLMLSFPIERQSFYRGIAGFADEGPKARTMSPEMQYGVALLFRIVFWERQIEHDARIRPRFVRAEMQRLFGETNAVLGQRPGNDETV